MFGNATSPAITITNAGLSHCSRPLRRFASHCPAVHHQAHMRPRRIASKAPFTKEGSHRSGTKVLDGKSTKKPVPGHLGNSFAFGAFISVVCHLLHDLSPVTCSMAPVTWHVTCHLLHDTCHLSPVTCYMTPVTCHLSPVTWHLSPVTCSMAPVTWHRLRKS